MDSLTPMLRQYRQVKSEHPDAILLFRLGDFYEMFFDDAKIASRALSLTLTARGRGTEGEAPMCGVPYHAAEGYIARLVGQGHRVAICDQMEDPRQTKGLVRRAVTRVVSPGTVTDPGALQPRAPNFIAAVVQGDGFGFAVLDLSTGDFRLAEHHGPDARASLQEQIDAFAPREILLREGADARALLSPDPIEGVLITTAPGWRFATETATTTLLRRFGTASLEGFGCAGRHLAIAAAGGLLGHLQETQKTDLRHVTRLAWTESGDAMLLDATTRSTLEVVENARDGGREGTLLSVVDRTATAMGGRLLRDWLLRPLLRKEAIEDRLAAVELLIERPSERSALAAPLGRVHDLERLLARCALGTANPRDLVALRESLAALPQIAARAVALTAPLLTRLLAGFDVLGDLHARLQAGIADDPPVAIRDGGILRDGFHPEVDAARALRRDSHAILAAIETRERARTGIPSLKVRYNKVFGYYIEISHAHRDRAPDDYVRKQTLVGAERYITPELKEHETQVLSAEERLAALEYDAFVALRGEVVEAAPRLRATALAVATLDALLSFAESAVQHGYVRPRIEEEARLEIQEGRHPVVERLLRGGERFVPNDCRIDTGERQILILTGPNMGGKSTYLRQVALIVLMGQAGSFVPAAAATLGLVDRIYSRVGASDNLARGQSTFLVEMNETANILNNATPRSLLLLDEVGRGTATFDGLSIAWSVAEYLHDTASVRARTLFATHYHELTELALTLPRVRNMKMLVREWNDTIIFLRKVVEGAADRSYGIQVARLAGLPAAVLERAREVLQNLEREELSRDGRPKLARHADGNRPEEGGPAAAADGAVPPAQLGLFAPGEDPIVREIRAVDVDAITPIEALNLLARLKSRLRSW